MCAGVLEQRNSPSSIINIYSIFTYVCCIMYRAIYYKYLVSLQCTLYTVQCTYYMAHVIHCTLMITNILSTVVNYTKY